MSADRYAQLGGVQGTLARQSEAALADAHAATGRDREQVVDGQHHLDVRVRDRLIAQGVLDPQALEQHIAELPDLEAEAENLGIDQPALNPRDNE